LPLNTSVLDLIKGAPEGAVLRAASIKDGTDLSAACEAGTAALELPTVGAWIVELTGPAPWKPSARRWQNNRAETSHQPFRRRERAMLRFRRMRTLQKFASIHASVHNHFNHERTLTSRPHFKEARTAALAEWRQIGAA
jgi:hypothetical protein